MAHRITVEDRRQYVDGKSLNGGGYIFYLHFDHVDNNPGIYLVSFGTSSEFAYCKRTGSFRECSECEDYITGKCEFPIEATDNPLKFASEVMGFDPDKIYEDITVTRRDGK